MRRPCNQLGILVPYMNNCMNNIINNNDINTNTNSSTNINSETRRAEIGYCGRHLSYARQRT